MEKIQFTDPDTNEVVEFAVESDTYLSLMAMKTGTVKHIY